MVSQGPPPCSCPSSSNPPSLCLFINCVINHPPPQMSPKIQLIEVRNGKICVRYNLSDLLKAPPRNDVVESDGDAFLGGNGVLQKEVPNRVANITIHNQTTSNHTKILTQVHSWVEKFVSIRYDYILNVLHEVQLHEEFEAGHVLYHWYWSHLQLGPPNR